MLDTKVTFIASEMYELLTMDALEYTGYKTPDEMWYQPTPFLEQKHASNLTDADWYREFPIERVCRQIAYNTQYDHKKRFTQYILTSIQHHQPLRILDFGCGIGITAFALAEKGHQVTAMDIRGTGTLEFLKWRCKKHNVPMTFVESEGGPPQLTGEYDVVIAMDSIEHIAQWRETIAILSEHIRPSGILFSNNAVLDDIVQPEHYELRPKAFIAACNEYDLRPLTQLSYVKIKEESVYA
jgi:2-polyprenyl-3-methyl-5-hydroxy-6-metoxy-1,4-benzoquinol methylase